MTLNQLETLSESELDMALYIINVIAPPDLPKMTFEPRHLTWFNHEQLIKKFLEVFPKLNTEGHPIYVSLMQKLGICIQIQKHPNPNPNETDATETNGKVELPSTSSIQPDVQAVTGSNSVG